MLLEAEVFVTCIVKREIAEDPLCVRYLENSGDELSSPVGSGEARGR